MLNRFRHLLITVFALFVISGTYADVSTYLDSINFSGAILITKNGKALYQLDKDRQVYQIGSITKVLTAVCILKLQEEGLLSVNDSIYKYIYVPYTKVISIKQLLSHTSGIPDYGKDSENRKNIADYASRRHSIADIKQLFINKPLMFDPGSFYSYSSSNYILLGEIIEKASGMKYEEYIREKILNPAGMVHTDIFQYPANMDGSREKISDSDQLGNKYIDLTYYSSAGGIVSTVEDMNKFGEALISEKIISRSSIEMMNTEQRNGYGLGWGVTKSGKKLYGAHSGKTYGYSSYLYVNEYNGVIVTVLSKSDSIDSKLVGLKLLDLLGIEK